MKNLLFIPYHDIYDFDNSGIMTREYSILLLLLQSQVENLYCIGKPRTKFDVKHYDRKNNFPKSSYEYYLKQRITNSKHLRYFTYFNFDIFLKKRAWWNKGYKKLINQIEVEGLDYENTVVYSNNPFAYGLIQYLSDKGATIVFDMMDNFYIHPSLNQKERNTAFEGYSTIAKIADFYSCNSTAIKDFCHSMLKRNPFLIKNGVFPPQKVSALELPQFQTLNNERKKYKRTVGYIGKLGLRIDEKLISDITRLCSDTLFVFIGPHLEGQKNTKLIKLLEQQKNLLYLGPVSSVYIYSFLEKFDILSIPHAVGKRENGGDPLKLYQYLNTGKPIITTPILGVDEFESLINITNESSEWVKYINEEEYKSQQYETPNNIYWKSRAKELIEFLKNRN